VSIQTPETENCSLFHLFPINSHFYSNPHRILLELKLQNCLNYSCSILLRDSSHSLGFAPPSKGCSRPLKFRFPLFVSTHFISETKPQNLTHKNLTESLTKLQTCLAPVAGRLNCGSRLS
jgi:hypothetical protein